MFVIEKSLKSKMAASFLWAIGVIFVITAVTKSEASAAHRIIRSPIESECGRLPESHKSDDMMPWHALVFKEDKPPKEYKYITSGTLVKPKLVISVGNVQDSQKRKPGNLKVAVGKSQQAWNQDEDGVQKSDVSEVVVHPQYHGQETYFQNNLALLVLATPISFTPRVQPACLDLDSGNQELTKGTVGKSSGFINSKVTSYDLYYVQMDECYTMAASDFLPYLTAGTICVKFSNDTLCPLGPAGSAFSIRKVEQGVERYHVIGILSIGSFAEDIRCHYKPPLGVTQLSYYREFLEKHIPSN